MPPDILLGVGRPSIRRTTEVPLPRGSTLLLYTDGLVERRDQSLNDGLELLRDTAAMLHAEAVGDLCDTLLQRLALAPSDDVCVLAVGLPDDR